MEAKAKRPRRRGPIPAALATTRHIAIVDGEIRTIERPLVEQLAPTDPLRLGPVASDPDVREALAQLKAANEERRRALLLAAASPEGADAHTAAVRFQQVIHDEILVPAILRAEERRQTLMAATPPDRAAMAAAAKLHLDLDTRLALERVLRRMPLAKDAALWRIRPVGAVGYLVAAVRREVKRIGAEREGGGVASKRDLEVYEFVQAHPRGRQRAPEWWAALLAEWNATYPDAPIAMVRGFQNAFRRGRQAATELPYDDDRVVAALEHRAADREVARETLGGLAARAGLTPAMLRTLAAELAGEDPPPWARQDLVNKLRKAVAKNS